MKKVLRKISKVVGWCLFSMILLLILVVILIQVPAVQNIIKNKIVAYLESKIHTRVVIGRLDIDFPKRISIDKIYFEDQQKDTLLACDSVKIDIAMLRFISGNIDVSYVHLKNVVLNARRIAPDTSFKFDYIIKAFASADPVVMKESAEPSYLKIYAGKIVLDNIRLNYIDDATGYDIRARLDKFECNIKTFDPFKSVYSVPEIQINGFESQVKQYAPKVLLQTTAAVVEEKKPVPLRLALRNIGLKNIRFDYAAETNKMYTRLNLDTLGVLVNKIDLEKTNIELEKVVLDNTSVSIAFEKTQKTPKKPSYTIDSSATAINDTYWSVQLTSLVLRNNSLKYDDNNYARVRSGLDQNHIHVGNFNMDVSSLVLGTDQYAGKLNQLSFSEQSGLAVNSCRAEMLYGNKEAFVKNLSLQTNNSKISASVSARYATAEELSRAPGKIFADASVDTCEIAVKEILLIEPGLHSSLNAYSADVIKFRGRAKGLLGDINIKDASLSGIGNTSLQLSGNIKGLPKAATAYYNFNVPQFITTRKDISGLIPAGTIPTNIRFPEQVKVKGYFRGTARSFDSKLNLNTTNGNAEIISKVNLGTEQYDVDASLENINLGYIVSEDSLLGNVSLKTNLKGKGFDYKKMDATIDALIYEAAFKNYTYKNLAFKADVTRGFADVQSTIDDVNIKWLLAAKADLSKRYPPLQLNLQLDTLNLHNLNLYSDTLSLKTNINADFPVPDPDSLSGSLLISDMQFYIPGRRLIADSVSFVAANDNGMQSLILRSDFVNAGWIGRFKFSEVPLALQHAISKFYESANITDSVVAPQEWDMNLSLNPAAKNIDSFLPELKGSDLIKASLRYSSESDSIRAAVLAPLIYFDDREIQMLQLNAASEADKFNYSISADQLTWGSLHLYQPSFTGFIRDNSIAGRLSLKDQKGDQQYHLAATLNQLPSGLRVSIDKDSLLLNYNKWDLSADNFVEYDSTGLLVNNFFLSREDQSLLINSSSPEHNAPLEVSFKNFHLKTLSRFTGSDSLQIDGLVNGAVTLKDLNRNPSFTSDITVKDLRYINDTIGDILAQVSNLDETTLQNTVTISGPENDIRLSGKYHTSEQRLEQQLIINSLGLHSLVNFSNGQIKSAGGIIKGQVDIAGNTDKPALNGGIAFENAFIVPSFLGEKYSLVNEKVNINSEGIHFSKFTMTDSAGNKAILDGSILSSEGQNVKFQLDLTADDFRLINSTKTNNADFYGKLNVDAAIKIRGDIQTPDVNATLRVNKQTDLIMVLPDVNPEVQDREGVVNFIDVNNPVDSSMIVVTDTMPEFKMLAGINLVTNIETDTNALFTLVIDERNGDALKIRGNADLVTGIDEGGKFSLNGSYELREGSYQLTLSVLKRKFDIQRGSTITWTGDPMQANLDITAAYLIKAPTIELMQQEIASKPEEEQNQYKERLPVTVWLKMQGDLLKPDITFDITIPEDLQTKWDDVETKLKQLRTNETEMSKQVFALLLLSRFVEEDPMASSAGGTSESLVRESVSRMLSDQLNNLAGSLVKGVDLNVELTSTEDYSTGAKQNQTDLTIGVSKNLLNDRLRVNVGSNFLLEGANANQATSNIAGDIAVDYALSVDGRYRIRAYRKNEYEGTVEGQIVESGLTFIITINYDKFRELFQKNKPADKKESKN